MPYTPVPIDALPPAPIRDSATFAADASTYVDAIPSWRAQANALAANMLANAGETALSAATALEGATAAGAAAAAAAASANAAAAAISAPLWVSGATYAADALVRSPTNQFAYRRLTVGAGSVDPALDPINWRVAQVADMPLRIVTSAVEAITPEVMHLIVSTSQTTLTVPGSLPASARFGIAVGNGRADNVLNPGSTRSIEGYPIGETMTISSPHGAFTIVNSGTSRGLIVLRAGTTVLDSAESAALIYDTNTGNLAIDANAEVVEITINASGRTVSGPGAVAGSSYRRLRVIFIANAGGAALVMDAAFRKADGSVWGAISGGASGQRAALSFMSLGNGKYISEQSVLGWV